MSDCSRLLHPLFEEMGEKAIEKSKYKQGGKKWMELDAQSAELFKKARTTFLYYNPEYRHMGK